MKMLEDCIDEIDKKISLCSEADKELYKSIYYHLSDYKDILNRVIGLNNEITNISSRWDLIKNSGVKND